MICQIMPSFPKLLLFVFGTSNVFPSNGDVLSGIGATISFLNGQQKIVDDFKNLVTAPLNQDLLENTLERVENSKGYGELETPKEKALYLAKLFGTNLFKDQILDVGKIMDPVNEGKAFKESLKSVKRADRLTRDMERILERKTFIPEQEARFKLALSIFKIEQNVQEEATEWQRWKTGAYVGSAVALIAMSGPAWFLGGLLKGGGTVAAKAGVGGAVKAGAAGAAKASVGGAVQAGVTGAAKAGVGGAAQAGVTGAAKTGVVKALHLKAIANAVKVPFMLDTLLFMNQAEELMREVFDSRDAYHRDEYLDIFVDLAGAISEILISKFCPIPWLETRFPNQVPNARKQLNEELPKKIHDTYGESMAIDVVDIETSVVNQFKDFISLCAFSWKFHELGSQTTDLARKFWMSMNAEHKAMMDSCAPFVGILQQVEQEEARPLLVAEQKRIANGENGKPDQRFLKLCAKFWEKHGFNDYWTEEANEAAFWLKATPFEKELRNACKAPMNPSEWSWFGDQWSENLKYRQELLKLAEAEEEPQPLSEKIYGQPAEQFLKDFYNRAEKQGLSTLQAVWGQIQKFVKVRVFAILKQRVMLTWFETKLMSNNISNGFSEAFWQSLLAPVGLVQQKQAALVKVLTDKVQEEEHTPEANPGWQGDSTIIDELRIRINHQRLSQLQFVRDPKNHLITTLNITATWDNSLSLKPRYAQKIQQHWTWDWLHNLSTGDIDPFEEGTAEKDKRLRRRQDRLELLEENGQNGKSRSLNMEDLLALAEIELEWETDSDKGSSFLEDHCWNSRYTFETQEEQDDRVYASQKTFDDGSKVKDDGDDVSTSVGSDEENGSDADVDSDSEYGPDAEALEDGAQRYSFLPRSIQQVREEYEGSFPPELAALSPFS